MNIGYVQGRLLRMPTRGYQAFPEENWVEEFPLARTRALSHVEWVVDSHTVATNPILTCPSRVKRITFENDIDVSVICFDFLMTMADSSVDKMASVVRHYRDSAELLGVSYVLLPFVDGSSLVKSRVSTSKFVEITERISSLFSQVGTRVLLETDLDPKTFERIMSEFDRERVFINYDLGNSAALGYDWVEEMDRYSQSIRSFHIKDRTLDGGPAPLGDGNAQWEDALIWWAENKHPQALTTMQTFRDVQGTKVFDHQLLQVRNLLGSQTSDHLVGEPSD